MATKIRLGELLVRAGVLDEVKLKAALAEQQRWGGRLGKILVDMNFVSEDLLVKALSKQLGIPRATFQNMNVPAALLDKLDAQFATANALCPEHYDAEKRVLTIATADPTNVQAIDEIRFKTGMRIQTTIAGEHQILEQIGRHLKGGAPAYPAAIDVPDLASSPPGFMPEEAATLPPDPGGFGAYSNPPSLPPPYGAGGFGPASPAGPPPGAALELLQRLEGAQRQQQKAIRVMLELLIEKGVLSRDEYLRLIGSR